MLVDFLRKNAATVKQSALVALEVIIRSRNVAHIPEPVLLELVTGLAPLVSEADLYQAHLALKVQNLGSNIFSDIPRNDHDHHLCF
jgi:hypothetical protein